MPPARTLRGMPCPSCEAKEPGETRLFITDRGDILKKFGQRLRSETELQCRDCKSTWLFEQTGSEAVIAYLLAGEPPAVEGQWAFSESAPQGEGTTHRSLLTLRREGDLLSGELADWGYNDFAEAETRSGSIVPVRGRWVFDHAWLALDRGEIGLEGGGTGLFFVKPFAIRDRSGARQEQLFVSRREEYLSRNQAFRTWSRPSQYDAVPDWVTRDVGPAR
jgi:hypothetical protein